MASRAFRCAGFIMCVVGAACSTGGTIGEQRFDGGTEASTATGGSGGTAGSGGAGATAGTGDASGASGGASGSGGGTQTGGSSGVGGSSGAGTSGTGGAVACDSNCNGCACPSNPCTMCCAQRGMVDVCSNGKCGCF